MPPPSDQPHWAEFFLRRKDFGNEMGGFRTLARPLHRWFRLANLASGIGTVSWLNGSRIRLAVRLGVVRALEDPLPNLFLLDYVASLRQHGWPESAVNKIQRQIKEELTQLSGRRRQRQRGE